MYPHGAVSKVSVLPTQMSVRITGLLPYTVYGFYVSATNYVGEGESSLTSTGITDESGKMTKKDQACICNTFILIITISASYSTK